MSDTPSTLGSMQGEAPLDHEELAELRRRAWREQGLLIISPCDLRLDARDRRILSRIAQDIYGEGGGR